jgi:hypothetical protein
VTVGEAADIVQRDDFHKVRATPDVIAARLLRAVTSPANSSIVRGALLEPDEHNWTEVRLAAAIGPLEYRILDAAMPRGRSRESGLTALSRPHIPAALYEDAWRVTGKPIDALLKQADNDAPKAKSQQELASLYPWPDSWCELAARAVAAISCLGLVLSDQGQAVDNRRELRGHLSKVTTWLMTTPGGRRVLVDAIRFVTDQSKTPLSPAKFDAAGTVAGRYDPTNRETNIAVRALAFGQPERGAGPSNGSKRKPKTFQELESELANTVATAVTIKEELLGREAPSGRREIESQGGLRLADVILKNLMDLQSFILKYKGDDSEDLLPVEEDESADTLSENALL